VVEKIVASIMLLLAIASPGLAQRSTIPLPPQPPAASQTLQSPYIGSNPDRSVGDARPLFFIGQLPVVVWTPVQQPYNSKNYRTQAARSLSDVDAF
jgi:hypothetical protein